MLSTYLYRRGIEYIFPDRKNNVFEDEELIVDVIYGKLRCGLAHFAFAVERIPLSRNDENLCRVLIARCRTPVTCLDGLIGLLCYYQSICRNGITRQRSALASTSIAYGTQKMTVIAEFSVIG